MRLKMKKIRNIFMTMLFLILLCALSACSSEQPQTDVAKELVSEGFVEIFLLAEDDFYTNFSEDQK